MDVKGSEMRLAHSRSASGSSGYSKNFFFPKMQLGFPEKPGMALAGQSYLHYLKLEVDE